jgi:hypothetical protein
MWAGNTMEYDRGSLASFPSRFGRVFDAALNIHGAIVNRSKTGKNI